MQSLIKPTLLAVTILLAGCRPPPEPLRIVSSPWAGYEPLYLARDLGYLSENSVRITELPSSNLNMEAFSRGGKKSRYFFPGQLPKDSPMGAPPGSGHYVRFTSSESGRRKR